MARHGRKHDNRAYCNARRGEAVLDLHECRECGTSNPALIGTEAPDTCAGCGTSLADQRVTLSKEVFSAVGVKTDDDGTRTYRMVGQRQSRKAIRRAARGQ